MITACSSDYGFDLNQNQDLSAQPTYVPPHLRNKPFPVPAAHNSTSSFSDHSFPGQPRFPGFNRSSASPFVSNQQVRNGMARGRGRGRGYGRGRCGFFGQGVVPRESIHSDPYVDRVTSDVSDKISGLRLTDCDADDTLNFDAYEDVPVEATGSDIPPPVTAFDEMDLAEALSANIKRCNYVKPTPIQRHALPIALAGRDLMACAQTGSGKTAAFCFPIISGLLKNCCPAPSGNVAHPSALILCPTRELACQINDEAKKFAYQTGLKLAVAYGGAPMGRQFRNLELGVDILVATPGRLADMIERGKVSLEMIKYLALDEADRMLDMGFVPQIRQIVMQMGMPAPGSRQTMLFSATFPNEIQRLASEFLSNYIFLSVGRVGSSTELIAQRVEHVEDINKGNRLFDLLRTHKANGTHGKQVLTLVFVETKKGADALESWLLRKGLSAVAIHGDKVQMEREQALRSFKSGATPILVATDVASRGLDIPQVAHVINFDLPKDIDHYVHRIGRTGRAGKSGVATAFFSEKNLPLAKPLVELMQEANQEVPVWLTQYAQGTFSYGADSRAQRYRRGKFGDHDFRDDNFPSNFGSDDYQHFGNADPTVDLYSHGIVNALPVSSFHSSAFGGYTCAGWSVEDGGAYGNNYYYY